MENFESKNNLSGRAPVSVEEKRKILEKGLVKKKLRVSSFTRKKIESLKKSVPRNYVDSFLKSGKIEMMKNGKTILVAVNTDNPYLLQGIRRMVKRGVMKINIDPNKDPAFVFKVKQRESKWNTVYVRFDKSVKISIGDSLESDRNFKIAVASGKDKKEYNLMKDGFIERSTLGFPKKLSLSQNEKIVPRKLEMTADGFDIKRPYVKVDCSTLDSLKRDIKNYIHRLFVSIKRENVGNVSVDLDQSKIIYNSKTKSFEFKGVIIFGGRPLQILLNIPLNGFKSPFRRFKVGDKTATLRLAKLKMLIDQKYSRFFYEVMLSSENRKKIERIDIRKGSVVCSVGINKYDDKGIKSLTQSFHDVKAMSTSLKKKYKSKDTIANKADSVKKAEFIKLVKSGVSRAIALNKDFVFHYAGHGLRMPGKLEDTHTFHFVPSDAKISDPKTWISGSEFMALLKPLFQRNLRATLILDSCNSGQFGKNFRHKNLTVVASSASEQYSVESINKGAKGGVLSSTLVELMKKYPNETLGQLYLRAEKIVTKKAFETKKYYQELGLFRFKKLAEAHTLLKTDSGERTA